MKAWSRGRTLAAGIGLILLANGVALFGAWWNRSGEPESQLVLSERELALPYRGYRHAENSGLALRLGWRVTQREGGEFYSGYAASGGAPEWLDANRMAELGFDTRESDAGDAGRRRYTRQPPREALLVLELAGPAWQQAVERARESAARHEAAAATAEGKDLASRANQAKRAREALEREEKSNSRLFAVDVGRDLATLRARYPDRGRYLIVKGTVRPRFVTRDKQTRLAGHIGDLGVGRINVPFDLRPVLESLQEPPRQPGRPSDGGLRYEARLAIGQRLEPWIVALNVAPNVPPSVAPNVPPPAR